MTATDHKQTYVRIWLALLILTIIEVIVAYMSLPRLGTVTLLLAFAATKMMLVALFYMHLRTETPILKLIVALPVPVAILFTLALTYDLPFSWVN